MSEILTSICALVVCLMLFFKVQFLEKDVKTLQEEIKFSGEVVKKLMECSKGHKR